MSLIKRILIVSNGFYPEISPRSFRSTELSKEFCRQGHDVTVISKFREYNYFDFLKEYPLKLKMWKKPVCREVPRFRQRILSKVSNGIARILLLLFEYPKIEEMFRVKTMLSREEGYDLMISFAVPYPVHWGVAWARKKGHPIASTWVADCGDPYMGDVLDTFRKPFYFKYLEKGFCRKADFITIPIEGAKGGYYPEFHGKIRIIPQGFHFEIDRKESGQNINDIPTFAYAGGFLPGKRDPRPFMDYLVKLTVPFKFLIFTNTADLISPYKDKLKEKLVISDYIPRHDLMNVLKRVDFLVNFDNNTNLNSPSKLIDYAISDNPVLNISKDSDMNDIMAFLNRDYTKRMILPDVSLYHISNISRLFLDLKN